jgi:TPR repeat protein
LQDLKSDAEKNVVEAQFILATMYTNGRGVPQDNHEAFRWFYRLAKEKGAALAAVEEQLVLDKFKKKNSGNSKVFNQRFGKRHCGCTIRTGYCICSWTYS